MAKAQATKEKEQESVTTESAPPANLPAVADQARPPAAPVERTVAGPAMPPSMPVTGFANLAAAIAQAMSEIGEQRVVKRGNNTFHHYKYATMQDINQALTPIMSKHGIVIMQTEVERGFMDNGAAVFATYDFTIMHKSGEVWPFPQRQTGVCNSRASNGKFDDKAINKCHTAARKYMLLALFQIPTENEEDADRGDNDGGSPPRQSRSNAPRERAEPPPPAEKLTPQALPTAGKTFMVWATEFVTQINMADNLRDLRQWKTLNQASLDLMAKDERASKLLDRINTCYEDAEQELNAKAGGADA